MYLLQLTSEETESREKLQQIWQSGAKHHRFHVTFAEKLDFLSTQETCSSTSR